MEDDQKEIEKLRARIRYLESKSIRKDLSLSWEYWQGSEFVKVFSIFFFLGLAYSGLFDRIILYFGRI